MGSRSRDSAPRAIIHKQILDEARDRPEAPIESLAATIPGASTGFVERVLEEYGDPNEPSSTTKETMNDRETQSTDQTTITRKQHDGEAPGILASDELSEEQRTTLMEVWKNPKATQQEIAERLGVATSTVNNRLNQIAGFDWTAREAFIAERLEKPLIGDGNGTATQAPSDQSDLRVQKLEDRLAELESTDNRFAVEPTLAHKAIHVCMRSDEFSEAEELALIKALL